MQSFRVGNEVEIKATNKFASPTVENLYKFAARSTCWLLILSASIQAANFCASCETVIYRVG